MKRILYSSIFLLFSISLTIRASDDHDHQEPTVHQEEADERVHNENESEAHKGEQHLDENEHGHEESSQVGPDKGILEADERHGIRLSPEAEKNFEVKRVKISNLPFTIGSSAVVYAGKEENLFRYRQGFYKRIDFSVAGKADGNLIVQSQHLRPGDEIVTRGLGFLRIAEIAAFGGAPEGHSH